MAARVRSSVAVRWAAVLAWMGLIFLLSSRPDLPTFESGLPGLEQVVGHLTEYGVLAVLLWWALRGVGVRHPTAWALAVATLYGATDEFHQSWVPGRTMSGIDLMIDLAGASAALLVANLVDGRRLPGRAERRPS